MQIIKITKLVVVAGKAFRVNEEYDYTSTITKNESCGCNGGNVKQVIYYRTTIGTKTYDIHNTCAVLISATAKNDVLSPEEYHTTLRGTIANGNDNRDYDAIRNKPDINEILIGVNVIR